jgi:carboxypeptidase Taq
MQAMSYSALSKFYCKIAQINRIINLLSWDASTMMPSGSVNSRSEDLALLESQSHELLISTELGDLIQSAKHDHLDQWQKANVREIERERGNALAISAELVSELTKASSECEMVWRTARKQNDFPMLLPSLARVVDLTREVAASRADYFNLAPYDAMLAMYDPGRTLGEVQAIMDNLAAFLPGFIQEIVAKQTAAIGFGGKLFHVEQQKELSLFCAKALGFNMNRGRIDTSAHPFCGGHSRDIRITSRYDEHDFLSGLSSIVHEVGHALYEQNLPDEYQDQAVGGNLWMTVHESQSLLAEKHIGTTREFFEFLHPKVCELFNVSGPAYSPDNLYKLSTRVQPSLIRVDADEVTYPAHIILRFNLEKEIIAGNFQLKDLPQVWREQMRALLGVEPDSDSNGCMQDIHWHQGSFGYFPTYTLGSILASQFFAKIKSALGDVHADIRRGEFDRIIGWLTEHVHSKGRLLSVSEVVTQATGKDIDVESYKEYLKEKYLP